MATETLIALMEGRAIGRLERRDARLAFRYDDDWRRRSGAIPLSLSMPLARADHPHDVVEPFLWGLLPDNDTVLERWARRFGVSRRNVFALLSEVGEDCAGAVQFVPPTRVEEIAREVSTVQWLSHADIAHRLRTLRDDLSAWRLVGDRGRFSLAGAQPKTALQRRGEHWVPGPRFFACREELVPSTRHVTAPSGAHVPCASSVAVIPRWGVPTGREPTTHILKPPIPELDGHVQNEHLCLSLARSLGFPAARSYVGQFEDEVAIVIERYDRVSTGDRIRRIHQEDLCQALGRHPSSPW